MPNHKILIVDDEKKICDVFSRMMTREGYSVLKATSGRKALKIVEEHTPHIIFLDIKMPELDGMEVLKQIKRLNPDIVVVILTAYGGMKRVIEATRLGAFDYLTKPFNIDKIKIIIEKALERQAIGRQIVSLREELKEKVLYQGIVGNNPKMVSIYKTISQVADVDTAVLIYGESGTGKELVAEAVHYNGTRKDKPFIAVDCASIPSTLLESELFGHEKGAFTGAVSQKPGKFEIANSGTIFLDEIGNLPLDTQAKLLRVLQEKQIYRVGGIKPIKVNPRVVAATNKDLEKAINLGEFKLDLYYRLNVIPIYIPPLRERQDDIPLLVDSFLDKYKKTLNMEEKRISEKALNLLMRYDWPGNVRELENVIERALVVGKHKVIWPEDLPERIRGFGVDAKGEIHGVRILLDSTSIKKYSTSLDKAVDRLEEDMIILALKETGGNMTKAARALKISLRALRYKVKKHGLNKKAK